MYWVTHAFLKWDRFIQNVTRNTSFSKDLPALTVPNAYNYLCVTNAKAKGGEPTNKKQMPIAVVGIALALLAVTANSSLSITPLYTYRMEQASSEMNFLPTQRNSFVYSTEKGYNLNYDGKSCYVNPFEEPTKYGETCPVTACPEPTCSTCPNTSCGHTCDTCTQPTCETCETCSTCPTQQSTCWDTCKGDTCWDTCEIDC